MSETGSTEIARGEVRWEAWKVACVRVCARETMKGRQRRWMDLQTERKKGCAPLSVIFVCVCVLTKLLKRAYEPTLLLQVDVSLTHYTVYWFLSFLFTCLQSVHPSLVDNAVWKVQRGSTVPNTGYMGDIFNSQSYTKAHTHTHNHAAQRGDQNSTQGLTYEPVSGCQAAEAYVGRHSLKLRAPDKAVVNCWVEICYICIHTHICYQPWSWHLKSQT